MASILVVDNYDSFVYNLVQYLAQLGAQVEVWRNDDERGGRPGWHTGFDGVLLSPGPGTPQAAGRCLDMITDAAGAVPLFGVCLGLQAITVAFGGAVGRAPELMHGKTDAVLHDGRGVFAGLPQPFTATRYHSLAARPEALPNCLDVSARTASGVIMGVRHRELPVEAVQFHPESVLTEGGHSLLANWLVACGDSDAPSRAVGLAPRLG